MGFGLDTEIAQDDLDRFIAQLNQHYLSASAAAGGARAVYWALRSEPDTPVGHLEETHLQWRWLEYRRYALAAKLNRLVDQG